MEMDELLARIEFARVEALDARDSLRVAAGKANPMEALPLNIQATSHAAVAQALGTILGKQTPGA